MNPRASYPTYSLSRGAPSPLGYFSMVKTKNPIIIKKWRRGRDSNSWSLAGSLVFKTSSLNHSDTSPYQASYILPHQIKYVNTSFEFFEIIFSPRILRHDQNFYRGIRYLHFDGILYFIKCKFMGNYFGKL